jgi:hypothetical protein
MQQTCRHPLEEFLTTPAARHDFYYVPLQTMDQSLTTLLMRTNRPNKVLLARIKDQLSFDSLFELLYHHERPLVLRAADAIEKITTKHQEFLHTHKLDLLRLFTTSDHPELKWYLAQLIARVTLLQDEAEEVWKILQYWTRNPNESKLVRVHALQSLYDLSRIYPEFREPFQEILTVVAHEPIPSLQARIRKLRNNLEKQAVLPG